MASDITITSLAAVGGVGQILLTAFAGAPAGLGCLPYMLPAKIEFWASAGNDRETAVKIADSTTGLYTLTGLTDMATRNFWSRAIDIGGEPGPFYPSSASAGVAGAASNAAIEPLLEDLKTLLLGEVNSTYGTITAGSRVRITSQAGPTGYDATAAVELRGGTEGDYQQGGTFWDVGPNGVRMRVISNKFVIQDQFGNILAVFDSDGKIAAARFPLIVAEMIAVGAIKAGLLDVGVINAGSLFLDGVVLTAALANFAATTLYADIPAPFSFNNQTTQDPNSPRLIAQFSAVIGDFPITLGGTVDFTANSMQLPPTNEATAGISIEVNVGGEGVELDFHNVKILYTGMRKRLYVSKTITPGPPGTYAFRMRFFDPGIYSPNPSQTINFSKLSGSVPKR